MFFVQFISPFTSGVTTKFRLILVENRLQNLDQLPLYFGNTSDQFISPGTVGIITTTEILSKAFESFLELFSLTIKIFPTVLFAALMTGAAASIGDCSPPRQIVGAVPVPIMLGRTTYIPMTLGRTMALAPITSSHASAVEDGRRGTTEGRRYRNSIKRFEEGRRGVVDDGLVDDRRQGRTARSMPSDE
mmetsp:Transcript_9466/g.20294  ORF Transcript_9466/g.20294 Transcript_9466/m.20294 type:complete len:189 (-) Transcript_9466:167-733(-)